MVIESQLKITNIAWNDSLNDPNSEIFQDLKLNLEMELDKTFCNNSENVNNDNGNITCYTKVIGFSEGSINVKFEIIKNVLMDAMPSADETFTEMEEIIVSNGIGNFEVDETSFELCKYITPSLNTQSCIKGLLVVRDFCFWAVWAAGPIHKKNVGGRL